MARTGKKGLWVNFIISIIGVLFSGYLSFSSIVLGYCPLAESCPILFEQPICIYGFALFFILFILSGFCLFEKINSRYGKNMKKGIFLFSFMGILFSGYYSTLEIYSVAYLHGVYNYSLLLPSCVYGFFMYVLILMNTWLLMKSEAI